MESPNYPPEPWNLAGQAYASAWRLPAERLPELPPGIRPVIVGGHGFVVTAWVDYQEGGLLAYRELMVTVAVRSGRGIAATITHIWVDSPTSMAGGRALWNIPKDLAEFEMAHEPTFTASARTADGVIAEAGCRSLAGFPLRAPVGFSVIQEGHKQSPVRITARPGIARSSWKIDPGGPLGFLHGHAPFASFALHDLKMRFGR
ncbi:MAG: acetoacetate decarboxylase family protein [Pseudonocardiaceae bacterium]